MSLQAVAMALGLAVGGADQAPAPAAPLSETEKSFIDAIAAADRAEIELSKSVGAHTARPAVRKLARTIADDDAANYHNLFSLCLAKNYPVAPQLDERHRDAIKRLSHAKSHRDAEKIWLDTVLVDEAAAAEMLERIAEDGKDAHLAQFANDTLALVRKHQMAVRELAGQQRG